MSKEKYVWVVQDPENASICFLDLFTTQKAAVEFAKSEYGETHHKFVWNSDKTSASVIGKNPHGQWDDMNPLFVIGKVRVNVSRRK